jgi:hypothetical protein
VTRFGELLRTLGAAGVEFIVVGGVAAVAPTAPLRSRLRMGSEPRA